MTAEEALEKQKPKKPIMTEPYIYGLCPSCNQVQNEGRYCWYCGQAIEHISQFGLKFKPDELK